MRYGLVAIASILLLSGCRSAPSPARVPASEPAPARAPAESRRLAADSVAAAEGPGGSARRDTTGDKSRGRTPARVASKPAAKRPAARPTKAVTKPTRVPDKKAPSTGGGVTVAGAPSVPAAGPPTSGQPAATAPSAGPATPTGVIRAPLPPRLDGQGGDATAVARVSKDSMAVVSESEVTRRTVEVFGDSLTRPSRGPEPVPESDDDEVPTWDIDVASYEAHARVERYVRLFTGPARDRIVKHLEAGSRYEPMIRAKFRAGGLPEDMYYLALVESGYNPHAYSRATAVGMWQFMVSTARGMGLRVDWWVDERRDPVRSTAAAVRFLRGLRAQFGSLYLAAAAYNGGPGRVARGLSRYADDLDGTTGDDRFFALADKGYLHRETREYVPQLIAAALIAKDPGRYGLKLYALPPFRYDSVRVGPQTPLAAVAMAAGTSVAALQDLNPHLIRGMTPPGAPSQVRLPYGMAVDFDSAFAALDPSHRVAVKRVVVKKGETLATIARRGGITIRDLLAYNPRLARSRQRRAVPGDVLLLPTPATAAAARSVPDPTIERHPRASGRARIHVVKRGENLSQIAKRYGTTTQALMRLNRLQRPVIFPGQTLVISGRRRR